MHFGGKSEEKLAMEDVQSLLDEVIKFYKKSLCLH